MSCSDKPNLIARRSVLAGLPLAVAAGTALAVEVDAARAHVSGAIDEIVTLMTTDASEETLTLGLLDVMERRLALEAVSRFVVGPAWRDLTEDERTRFTTAFSGSIARTYARRFTEVQFEPAAVRQVIFVTNSQSAGRKGVLVQSEIRPPGFPVVNMDYLVSDRSGKLAIVDVVIQGISMAVTQRDIVGGMLSKHGGDINGVIDDLDRF